MQTREVRTVRKSRHRYPRPYVGAFGRITWGDIHTTGAERGIGRGDVAVRAVCEAKAIATPIIAY
jgi:hypothetical protein